MTQYYTYLYIDPTSNVPFYVGKGTGNRGYSKYGRNRQMRGRLSKLRELGIHPDIELCECADEEHAFREEIKLIRCYGRRDLGLGSLLNLADGGEGGIAIYGDANPSKRPEVRKKISERNPSRRPEVRQQISASKVGDKNPMKRPEQRQRMSQHNPMYNPEVLERNAASKRGKKNSPHTRALISIGNLGKHPLPADSQCPHCGFRSNRMVIARWHMGNCKHLRQQNLL